MVMTVTDVLNYWNQIGVFSYVIPFLLIFAVVFAILQKSNILNNNRAIDTIVAASCGLLALQFDMVGIFFSNIFPKMGVGLAVVLVILLFLGFVGIQTGTNGQTNWTKWIGIVAAVLVVFWALSEFAWFGGGYYGGNFMWWLGDYFWSLVVLAAVIGAIYWVSKSNST
jgi:hypothetical protein